jgi:hypothetical protein
MGCSKNSWPRPGQPHDRREEPFIGGTLHDVRRPIRQREAIAQGVHSADVVLNILARQRDPGPAATILTPAALTLHHPPVADCAR